MPTPIPIAVPTPIQQQPQVSCTITQITQVPPPQSYSACFWLTLAQAPLAGFALSIQFFTASDTAMHAWPKIHQVYVPPSNPCQVLLLVQSHMPIPQEFFAASNLITHVVMFCNQQPVSNALQCPNFASQLVLQASEQDLDVDVDQFFADKMDEAE